ncbi:uncharacterized protein LOC108100830 [Drosophila ficusphila]|uniref:uncharacterized protein LOC108100830 n=1 Tax=Drosophila ficusphila TaxID=30025 RepID=UPI0007E83FF0|nr:uncharacterized protein LOC108100830 [Drosophila ficusphila]
MKSHIFPLLFLFGIISAVLIAGHSHDFIGLPDESSYDLLEESGSGYNSAEEFMNAMDDLVRRWQEYDAADENSTDYPRVIHDETTQDSIDIVTKPAS